MCGPLVSEFRRYSRGRGLPERLRAEGFAVAGAGTYFVELSRLFIWIWIWKEKVILLLTSTSHIFHISVYEIDYFH